MSDLPTTQPQKLSIAYSAAAELTVELAKMLALVAPSSMTAEQQELWLRAAADALDGIRASEVAAVSAELRRSVTRHNQIVPEIARLVAEHRKRPANGTSMDEVNAERRKMGLGPVHWVKRDGRMVLEDLPMPPEMAEAIRRRRDVMDRRGEPMSESETAELNHRLEKLGATARYRSDGSRYMVA